MSKPCEDRCLEHPTWVCEREDGHDGMHLAIAAGAWRDDGVAVPFVLTGPESVESGLADAKLVLTEMWRAHESPSLKTRCRAALEAVLVVERAWRRAMVENGGVAEFRAGFEFALDHVEISTYNGFHATDPVLDTDYARSELEKHLAERAAKEVGR